MSSPTTPTVKQPFLPDSRSFRTDDLEELEKILHEMYTQVASGVNNRVIGLYDKIQVVTGEKWFDNIGQTDPGPLKRRQSFRKIFTETALAAAGNITQNHGIAGITAFTDFRVMAQGDDGWFYKGPSPNISMRVSTTQYDITNNTAANFSNIIIVVEYLLN